VSTTEEIEGYVWNTDGGKRKGEEPVKDNDHGCDAMRYLVMHFDHPHGGPVHITGTKYGCFGGLSDNLRRLW
jgi:hypothetical protein